MTDYARMRNRLDREFVDEELRANQRVFRLQQINILEDKPSLPAPSIATVAENGRLSSLAISALKDVQANMQGRLNPENLKKTSISTGDFAKSREAFINWFSNLKYRVIPTLGSSTSGDLLRQTASDVITIISELRKVITMIQRSLAILITKISEPRQVGTVLNWAIARDVLTDELKTFSSYLNQVSSVPSAIQNILPTSVKLQESVPIRAELQQADQEEMRGEGRKTWFVEDNNFYVPEEEEEEPMQRAVVRPTVKLPEKRVYQGQGMKDKTYSAGQQKIILEQPPAYDPIGGQLSDIRGADEKFEREVLDDNLRFKVVDKKRRK
jgi:hypothetical protein